MGVPPDAIGRHRYAIWLDVKSRHWIVETGLIRVAASRQDLNTYSYIYEGTFRNGLLELNRISPDGSTLAIIRRVQDHMGAYIWLNRNRPSWNVLGRWQIGRYVLDIKASRGCILFFRRFDFSIHDRKVTTLVLKEFKTLRFEGVLREGPLQAEDILLAVFANLEKYFNDEDKSC